MATLCFCMFEPGDPASSYVLLKLKCQYVQIYGLFDTCYVPFFHFFSFQVKSIKQIQDVTCHRPFLPKNMKRLREREKWRLFV